MVLRVMQSDERRPAAAASVHCERNAAVAGGRPAQPVESRAPIATRDLLFHPSFPITIGEQSAQSVESLEGKSFCFVRIRARISSLRGKRTVNDFSAVFRDPYFTVNRHHVRHAARSRDSARKARQVDRFRNRIKLIRFVGQGESNESARPADYWPHSLVFGFSVVSPAKVEPLPPASLLLKPIARVSLSHLDTKRELRIAFVFQR